MQLALMVCSPDWRTEVPTAQLCDGNSQPVEMPSITQVEPPLIQFIACLLHDARVPIAQPKAFLLNTTTSTQFVDKQETARRINEKGESTEQLIGQTLTSFTMITVTMIQG